MLVLLRSVARGATLLLAVSPAAAQLSGPNQTTAQVEESMKAEASSANIQAWLKSNNPRLIAWGAYFARENNDAAALALAAGLVRESLYQGGPCLLCGSAPQNAALSQVLDALIQRRITLSAEMLRYVSHSHPVQALILLSMLPSAEQTKDLEEYYSSGQDSLGFSRASAMLLSKSPPRGFAASVLSGSEERLILHIALPVAGAKLGFGSGLGARGGCGDYGPGTRDPGWPEQFYYLLHENDRTNADPLLVEAGGDRITWERAAGGRFHSCSEVGALSSENRHHLLAEMLGERDEAMLWLTHKDMTIEKETEEQVKREIGAAILAEQVLLQKSVEEFQTKGLITADEAKTVLPKLSITIRYEGFLNRPE
ncbi:MAG: hypothetical protein M3O20_13825 [Acidobacteriota bacterium]|nr:hypothetical protein [Acidobacteriota bacterium]MDP9114742.1 hypothetical protein [Acidobacteriota bacterium]